MSGVAVSLGSNLKNREDNIKKALRALRALPDTRVINISHIYETEPMGIEDQPLFLNAAALLDTGLSPHAFLGACLGIEAALGRVRKERNGPRVIDIDLLFYEGVCCETPELVLPHPRISERAFVLTPLCDIFPDGNVFGLDFKPQMGKTLKASGVNKYIDKQALQGCLSI